MTIKQFIQANRREIDRIIHEYLRMDYGDYGIAPRRVKLNDGERRLWILNIGDLYHWAKEEGAKI